MITHRDVMNSLPRNAGPLTRERQIRAMVERENQTVTAVRPDRRRSG
jgi:hypothetical protein